MAEAVTSTAFLNWAASVGVGYDPAHPDADWLRLVPRGEWARFWVLPDHAGTWPEFARAILEGLDGWNSGYLWPKPGRWPTAAESSFTARQVRDVVLRAAGVPDGWAGAVCYARAEQSALLAVMFMCMAFGTSSRDDLYFVPDHGRQVVQFHHHDVVHVECGDEVRMAELVGHMRRAGYLLPEEPPDASFDRPDWMPQGRA